VTQICPSHSSTKSVPMDNKPDFDIEGIGAILKRGRLYVPPHQRDYYWSPEKVVELFDDYKNGVDYGLSHFPWDDRASKGKRRVRSR